MVQEDQMRLQNQILIIRVFLNVFILSLLGPLCTEAAVKTGPEFQVNTMDILDQDSSSVTDLSGGGFVVTWQFYNGLSDYDVYGQLFDSTGNKVGSEFQVNTYTDGRQMSSSVTGLSGGGFVVTWQSYEPYIQDGFDYGVYGQLFDSFGNKVGSEFQVNTRFIRSERNPSVAAFSEGGFVVTWESYQESAAHVYYQLFDSSGQKIGSETQVNTYLPDIQWQPSVSGLYGGGFIVTWASRGQDGNLYGVYGQLFDSFGNKVGSEFQVNTYTNNSQDNPSVTGLSGGGFVVTWHSSFQDGSDYSVYGQLFDSTGNKVGSEFRVNTYTNGRQQFPSVTGLSGGGFVVTWHSYLLGESRYDIYGQLFDSTGNKVGSEFRVNTYTNSDQVYPSVTGLSGGGFVVTWESYLQDGWGYGIYGQLFEISLEIKNKAMPWIPLLLLDD
jgi:hypothetical protein